MRRILRKIQKPKCHFGKDMQLFVPHCFSFIFSYSFESSFQNSLSVLTFNTSPHVRSAGVKTLKLHDTVDSVVMLTLGVNGS